MGSGVSHAMVTEVDVLETMWKFLGTDGAVHMWCVCVCVYVSECVYVSVCM